MLKAFSFGLGVAIIVGFAWRADAQAIPSQHIDLQGKVDRFTLSSNGLPDGFLLDDGTEVHVAAHLSKQLRHAVRRGESVRVTGLRVSGARVVIASFVLGETTHETVIDKGETGMGVSTPATGTPDSIEEGEVTQLLHGPRGQVDGALLDNGLIVRLPPDLPVERPELFVVGQHVAVKGEAFDTEYGRVLRIDAMGASTNELTPVRPPGFEPLPASP